MSQKCSKIPIWVRNSRNLASFPQKSAQISTKKTQCSIKTSKLAYITSFSPQFDQKSSFRAHKILPQNDCFDCYKNNDIRCDDNNGG